MGESIPDAMISFLRAFIAIEIPHEIRAAIQVLIADLRQTINRSSIRWVPTQNIHLTLKFLGDVSPANIEILKQMLSTEAAQVDPFSINIGTLGVFPNLQRTRVVWIGIEVPAALETLHRSIESATRRLGYESDNRPFSPHLTIGRINQRTSNTEKKQIRDALERVHVGNLGEAVVNAVHLFRSDLQSSGVIYTRLYSAPLRPSKETRGDI